MLAIGCALALLITGALMPTLAGAQESAAGEEYQLALPEGDGGAGSAGGGNSSEPPSDSDGSGASLLLILLAAVAAVCTGLAVWRLRKDSGDDDSGSGHGTTSVTSEQQSL